MDFIKDRKKERLIKAINRNWTDYFFFFTALHKWVANPDEVSPASILLSFLPPNPSNTASSEALESSHSSLKKRKKIRRRP